MIYDRLHARKITIWIGTSVVSFSVVLTFLYQYRSHQKTDANESKELSSALIAPVEPVSVEDLSATLAEALSKSGPYKSLSIEQQQAIVFQSASLFSRYLDTDDPASIEKLMMDWGGGYRSDDIRQATMRARTPRDAKDRIVRIEADRAIVESESDQITGYRDGFPVRIIPDRLDGASALQIQLSSFAFPQTTDPASFNRFAVVVPFRFANGDHAMIAFFFRWFAMGHRWIPSRVEFEREHRPYFGAPLF